MSSLLLSAQKWLKLFWLFVFGFYLLLRSFANSKANEMQKMHIFRGNKINHHHHQHERIVSNTCNALEFFHCWMQYTVCVWVWVCSVQAQVSNLIYHLREIIPLIPLHHLSFTLFRSLSLEFFDVVQLFLCEIFLLHMLRISNLKFCFVLLFVGSETKTKQMCWNRFVKCKME